MTTKKNTDTFLESIFSNISHISFQKNENEKNLNFALKKYEVLIKKYEDIKWSSNVDENYILNQLHDHLIEKIGIETFKKLNIRKQNPHLLKEEAYDILVMLEDFYEDAIYRELLGYNREICLITLYKFASILSLINFNHRGWKNDELVEKSKTNFISELISIEYKDNKFFIDNYFGEIKKTIEFSIHYILNSDQKFFEEKEKDFDFPKLAALFTLLSNAKEFRSALNILYNNEGFMQICDGGIYLSETIAQNINSQMRKSSEVVYPLNTKETNQVYDAFLREFGYNPLLIEEYIKNENNMLNYKNSVSCIEEDMLIEDISKLTGQKFEDITLLLKELTLYPIKNKNYYSAAFSVNNRLFRTALIKIDNSYLISNYLLGEVFQYFKYRILRNQLSFHKSKHMRNVTKEKFDEINLNILKEILTNCSFAGDVNFSLNDNKFCEHLFNETKDLPQELDFYVIKDKCLYIMEMKNSDLSRSLKNINKNIEKVTKGNDSYLSKLNNLNTVIMRNKIIMHKALNDEFEQIHLFLSFNNPHYFTQNFTQERGVTICSIQDFIDFIKQLVI